MLSIYWLAAGLAVIGLSTTLSALSRWDRQTDLTESQQPFQPSVGDEAQAWLERRQGR